MNAAKIATAVLALLTLIPAASWNPHIVPRAPTHVPGPAHVDRCQRLAGGWTPAASNPSLTRWAQCMGINQEGKP